MYVLKGSPAFMSPNRGHFEYICLHVSTSVWEENSIMATASGENSLTTTTGSRSTSPLLTLVSCSRVFMLNAVENSSVAPPFCAEYRQNFALLWAPSNQT